jgi:hypothetical protein
MKKLIVFFGLCGIIFSCKKESGGGHPKETLLSEITRDSLKSLRFEYNSDNLLTKIESYKFDPVDNSMTSYIDFQYTAEGYIKQYTSYQAPGNLALAKGVVQYDSAGRLQTATLYDLAGASPNTPAAIATYTYNGKGQVIKMVRKNGDGEFTVQNNLLYYDDGHLKEVQSWHKTGDELWMAGKVSYSIPDGYFPSGMEQLGVILGNDFIASMYSQTISHVDYSQAGVILKSWNEHMSARVFNDDGTLSKQIVTDKYIKPAKDDKVTAHAYKYIQQ